MKLFVRLMLVFFITFLSAPTIVTLIEKNNDISLFYDFAEEEIQKDFKEIKGEIIPDYFFAFTNFTQIKNTKIIFENLSRHDNVSEEIFSPPPEVV